MMFDIADVKPGYIYAFSRPFYPKRLTEYLSLYILFVSMCVLWELNPQYLRC